MTTTALTIDEEIEQRTDERREEFVGGLRELLRFLEDNRRVVGDFPSMTLLVPCDADDFRERVSMLGGSRSKVADDKHLSVQRDFGGGVKIDVYAAREKVCEAVVVGTRTVEVPDPDALAAVPTIEKVEDIIEWRCAPVLPS